MRKIIISGIAFLLLSCFVHKGEIIDTQCRPKNPNFKLFKVDFQESDKLTYNKVYVADNFTKAMGYSFYADGRLVFIHSKNGLELKPEDVFGKSWQNAPAIGYWRLKVDRIETEYFSCANSGNYIKRIGLIKGDTIFFERDCGSNPFKREKCFDKYVLSNLKFN